MAGRPTEHKEDYNEQARKLCLLGATDKDLADFFDVSEQTVNAWKIKHPEFLESLKKGKDLADANIADRLYQRAMGFEHDSEDIKVINQEEIVRVPIRKIYPPDTTAAIFWLKNRQRKSWRDKVETGFTDGEGNDVDPIKIYIPDNGRRTQNTTTEGVSGESIKQ